MNPISEALRKLVRDLPKVVKGIADQIPFELSAVVNDYLQARTKPDRKSKSGNLYFSTLNKTSKLRTLYGNIQRAVTPGGKGNISEVVVEGGQFVIRFGYDPNVTVKSGTRSQSLLYAVYNEQGTATARARPFLQPAFEQYVKEDLPLAVREIEDYIKKVLS